MRPLVVLALDPCEQKAIETVETAALVAVDASEEAAADSEEPPLQLGTTLRLVRARVDELDAQPCTQCQQEAAAEDLAICRSRSAGARRA